MSLPFYAFPNLAILLGLQVYTPNFYNKNWKPKSIFGHGFLSKKMTVKKY